MSRHMAIPVRQKTKTAPNDLDRLQILLRVISCPPQTRAKMKDTHGDVRLHRDKVTETKHTQRDTLACK